MTKDRKGPIATCVKSSMEKYFHDLNGEKVSGVYDMVLHEMEKPFPRSRWGSSATSAASLSASSNVSRSTVTGAPH